MHKILILLLGLFLMAACSSPVQKEQIEENEGLRIISLAPSVSKELIYLGLKDQIVGATSYCDISAELPDLVIGTATEVNLEKVLLLKPNIVFATGLTKANTIEALKKNGIEVYVIRKQKSFEDICKELIIIGQKVNQEQKALEIVEAAILKIEKLKAKITQTDQPLKIFFQIGAQPLFTVIPNTFMDDYITLASCENLAYDFTRGSITRESVLTRNPDVIFIVTMGIVGEDEISIWEKYPEISAVKNKKIFVIDSNLACTPSVESFVQSLEIIIHNIY